MWNLKRGKSFLPKVSLDRLNALYAKERDVKAKLRLLGAIRRKKGESIDDISYALEKSRNTIHGWLHRFQERGLSGARDKKQPGKIPLLKQSDLKKLRRELMRGPAHVPGGLWTTLLLQNHIKKKYGVSYKRHNVIRLLHKLGFSIQKPRKQHYKSDKKKQEQFKKKQSNFQHTIIVEDGRLRHWTNVPSTLHLTSAEAGRSKVANP